MILIIDFGSQTTHLIHRRLRDMGVDSLIIQPEEVMAKSDSCNGIILSGGPSSVYEDKSPTIDPKVFKLGLPIFGICYGWQLMAHLLGGEVKNGREEFGTSEFKIVAKTRVLEEVVDNSVMWMSHGDSIFRLPESFEILGGTAKTPGALCGNVDKHLYGSQFHPEADHSEYGNQLLRNFAEICGETIQPFSIDVDQIVEDIKTKVGSKHVLCAVSGGVDSSVAATLIAKAVGSQLHPVYVESGLMRPGTKEWVYNTFKNKLGVEPKIVEAKDRFLAALSGVTDPEQKRKTIGKLYVDIFEEEKVELAKSIDGNWFLAQGTIYSDIIESKGSGNSAKIKSHHNVGGLPEHMNFELLEPLRDYYKDQVREIGRIAGLEDDIVDQQVFPGPGYAIRILGEVTAERLEKIYVADKIVMEEIKSNNLFNDVYMSFAILTGAMSVAVKGDARQYDEAVALRIIQSNDVMTSNWAQVPYEVLNTISTRIVQETPGVSRVVYDITNKPPATMEWE